MTIANRFPAFPARSGHFQFESGHHGDLWLDLDSLYADPVETVRLASALADAIRHIPIDVVCGPMTGGALLAQMTTWQLGAKFAYTERIVDADSTVRYTLPGGQRIVIEGAKVAIVDDVINAGSASGKTLDAVVSAGGTPVLIGALLILGAAIDRIAEPLNLEVIGLERREVNLWAPDLCPLCATGIPVESPLDSP